MSTPENTSGTSPQSEPSGLPSAAPAARPQRVRLNGPADLVATVPYLIGHTGLADDIVIVAQSGPRVVLTVRVDLTALTAGALWTSALPALANAGARTINLIAYPAGPLTDATLRGLHQALAAACAARPPGLDVERVLTVSGDRWWAHDPTSANAPHGPGTVMPDNPGLTLQLALGYGVPAASRDHAVAVLDPHPDPVRSRVRHLIRHLPPATREQRSAVVDAAHAARADRPTGWRLEEAAAVLDAVGDVTVRDLALAHLGDDAAWWVWSTLLPYAPQERLAPVATLLAVAAHQRGDGVLAGAALDKALAADPRYSLAGLFQQILRAGITPTAVKEMINDAVAELTAPGH
jgi:hypothetical protein